MSKKITTEIIDQNIVDNKLKENLNFDPSSVRRFFVNNIFTRTLSHLVGLSSDGAKMLLCTTAGILKVASSGSGFEHNDVHSGNGDTAYIATPISFDAICGRVELTIWDNPAMVKRSSDGITFDDEFEVTANTILTFDCTTSQINIKNKTAGSVARYQIVGWY